MTLFTRVVLTCVLVVTARGAFAADDSPAQCAFPRDVQPFEFASEGHHLVGFVDAPAAGKSPAIVILPGSGSTDVMHEAQWENGYYANLRRAFRSAGFATVIWDRAGNGCSSGGYPHGTPLKARASEVVAAVAALKAREDIDPKRIGLWGISQGGWVAPMAAVRSPDVAFLILVSSPGRDAVAQLEYQAINSLHARGVAGAELQSAADTLRRTMAIMRAGGTQEEFAAAVSPLQAYPVFRELGITVGTPEGYRAWQSAADFVYRPDTALRELTQPTLAIFGDHDTLVDWRDSIAVYRESFRRGNNAQLTVKVFKNADHNLFNGSRFANGYLDTMVVWLQRKVCPCH